MKTLQEDIKTGNFKKCYLLFGEEAYLIRQYKDRLLHAAVKEGDTMNISRFGGKDTDVKAVIDMSETLPFFAERRVILIEESNFLKSQAEGLAEYIKDIPDTTVLIFAESEVDKRNRTYKQIAKEGRAVEFKRQTEETLRQWVLGRLKKEGKKITREVMDLFLVKTGNDMELIQNELEKLICFTLGKEIVGAGDVESICSNRISGKIFEMVDAIAYGNQKKAMDLYMELLYLKEPSMRILFLLTRQFQILMQLKEMEISGFSSKEMASKAGIPEFAVRKNLGQAKCFRLAELELAVRDGVQAEEDIKTGRRPEQLALELYLVKYCNRS